MLWKCCIQYASKFGKLSSGHRTGKGQFSFQSQRQCQRMFKLPHDCTHLTRYWSNAQNSPARLQRTWTMNFQMFRLDSEKAEEPEIKLPTSMEHRKSKFQKNIYFYVCWRLWLCGSQQTVKNSERDGNTRLPDLPPICGSRSNRTVHGTDWFQIGKGVHQGCILSLCLFNFHAEYIMRNAGLDEAEAEINYINNLRHIDDITFMEESEEELKSLLMTVKRRVKKLA